MKSIINKPWGTYEIIHEGENFLIKKIIVKPHGKLSFQSHNHRSEHWTVVKGIADVKIENENSTLNFNESIYIPVKSKHLLANNQESDLIIIEIWCGTILKEEDIIRYEDIYGRL